MTGNEEETQGDGRQVLEVGGESGVPEAAGTMCFKKKVVVILLNVAGRSHF